MTTNHLIKSKIHTYGHEKESSWPSEFGTGEKGVFHIDKDTQEVVEGYPQSTNLNFGTAPIVIFDSMPPEVHPDAGRVIESRSEWERIDEKHNRLCFGSREEPSRHIRWRTREEEQVAKQDRRRAGLASIQAFRSNPTEVKQKLQKRAEEQQKTLKKSGLTKQVNEAIKEQK